MPNSSSNLQQQRRKRCFTEKEHNKTTKDYAAAAEERMKKTKNGEERGSNSLNNVYITTMYSPLFYTDEGLYPPSWSLAVLIWRFPILYGGIFLVGPGTPFFSGFVLVF